MIITYDNLNCLQVTIHLLNVLTKNVFFSKQYKIVSFLKRILRHLLQTIVGNVKTFLVFWNSSK